MNLMLCVSCIKSREGQVSNYMMISGGQFDTTVFFLILITLENLFLFFQTDNNIFPSVFNYSVKKRKQYMLILFNRQSSIK